MKQIKVALGKGDIRTAECDALGLLFVADELKLSLAERAADKATHGAVSQAIERGFKGKKDDVERIPAGSSSPFGEVIMVGLGERDKLDLESYRRAGGMLVGALKKTQNARVHVEMRDPFRAGLTLDDITRALVIGAILKNYRFNEYKSKNRKPGPVDSLELYGESRVVQNGVDKAMIHAEAQCYVRDLVNRPSADLTPELFAAEARKVAREHHLKIKVFKEAELKKAGMNAILAVGQGSHHPPRLVELIYQGTKRSTPDVVLVGKGITFDSGGISLKPSANMHEMKGDMSGAACVLAALAAAARRKLKLNVVGIAPLAENMPSGRAQRPGDVIKTAAGITVEVLNTDAEGRLILADALDYAAKLKPRVGIVDLATLTGACTIALGVQAIGLMGNDEELLARVSAAGHATGERTWILPLWEEYDELIESKVADIQNSSTRKEAGTIVGGIFLKRFVGDTPWAHLDIASVFWAPKAGPYLDVGPTGKGARLLIRLLESLQ